MNISINRIRLEEILNAVNNLSIGVVGDFTVDGYWYADMEQSNLSRETATYPRPIIKETYSLGGAANTAWNLSALGVQNVVGFSVIGDDWRGKILQGLLSTAQIQASEIFTQADRLTPFYGKVMLTAVGRRTQEDARLDFINIQPISIEIEDALLVSIEASLPKLDGLIIADYQSLGVVTHRVTQGLLKLAGSIGEKPMVVDSRERAGEFRQLILKPNDAEAVRLFFPGRNVGEVEFSELSHAAVRHNLETGQPIIITRGENGCLVAVNGECVALPGVHMAPPVDTVGAGDSFLASFTAAIASGANAIEAGCLANLSAAVTITKIGVTGTASPEEVLSIYEQWAKNF